MNWRGGGLGPWMWQRISAIYMAGFVVYFLIHMLTGMPGDYQVWRAWVAQPGVNTALVLFFAAMLVHMWVGLRDVIIDYVHPTALRFVVLVLVAVALWAMAAWMLRILYDVGTV